MEKYEHRYYVTIYEEKVIKKYDELLKPGWDWVKL